MLRCVCISSGCSWRQHTHHPPLSTYYHYYHKHTHTTSLLSPSSLSYIHPLYKALHKKTTILAQKKRAISASLCDFSHYKLIYGIIINKLYPK